MNLLKRLSELKFSRLWRLAWIGVKNPLLVMPTHRATNQTMRICNKLYGESHHGDNRANAIRHALWNILIAQKTIKTLKTQEKAISWAEHITSLHEELMPNRPLEKAMDLHNNEVGRIFFPELQDSSKEEIIEYLEKKASEAVKIKTVEDVTDFKGVLVYLEE
jgi:CRISPR/Cas system-associated endonuclease Cas3-HD